MGILTTLRDAVEGDRNNTLYWAVTRLVEASDANPGFDFEGHVHVVAMVAAMIGLDEEEIPKTIQSARKGATL